ncbi:hypothetical protein M2116_000626 [Aurantimicrobium minutum]|uniref:hypothetical protein n=1 Tax=Aurantimicrobium minutum TaxID=708131 RepID=UPI00240691C7|nr:hypothetical protein [Aurantimicrobium minutum]MDF9809682.1 hypothetical protein [Aurantimicrobium minutum]
MSGGMFGGGIVFAIAAALWVVYLIPTYLRRRNFDATERNAVRMQQTIRALAETTDVPEEIRVEASARAVIEQKRVLRQAEAAARAQVRQATGRAVGYDEAAVTAARRARRNRLASAVFLLATILGVAAGIVLLANGGSWETLAISCIAFAIALVVQEVVVSVSAPAEVAPANTDRFASEIFDQGYFKAAPASRAWTPTALPRPLHLSEGTLAQAVVQSQLAADRMRQNAQESALVERMSMDQAGLENLRRGAAVNTVPATPVQAPVADSVTARLAGMGVVAETESAQLDLDAVLRRRRAS